jgi:hypothetical protein
MANVVASLPELGVNYGGWEKNKEIYVLSVAADLRGLAGKGFPEIAAAHNETLPNVVPAIMGDAAMKWMLISVSNVFQRVQRGQPVSLTGSGILLYPKLDPGGMLALHFLVVESDAGQRNLGKVLGDILADATVKAAVNALAAAASITQPLVAKLMSAVVSQIPAILKNNKDDILLTHSHSGFDFDDYGVITATPPRVQDFKVANDRAYCTLRLRLT